MYGAPEIDEQHQELVAMFNKLDDAVKNHQPRETVYGIIDDIISFSSLHFATEEQLMGMYGYPELEAHSRKHKQLIDDARHFREKLNHVGEQDFLEWFHHWPFANILAHIQYADNQPREHINQGGAQE